MVALTFSTGITDAVGFLGLDRVFVGNMTGNVVVLGMAMIGADDLPVLGPVLALFGFMVGAAVSGRTLRSHAHGSWEAAVTLVLTLVGLTVMIVAVLIATAGPPSHTATVAITTVLGVAMGMQAATARTVAVKDVTTVVVTSSITGLAAESWFGANVAGSSGRRIGVVLALLGGAAVGAAALRMSLSAGLFISAAVVLLVAGVGALTHRRGAIAKPARKRLLDNR